MYVCVYYVVYVRCTFLCMEYLCTCMYVVGIFLGMIKILFFVANVCDSRFSLEKIQTSLSTTSRLNARQKSPPSALNTALQARESSHGTVPFQPSFPIESVAIGAFYLEAITDKYERIYKRR